MDALRKYVSNLDRRVYLIENLPEEVIAVVFAYVSRSPNSFRDNLAKLLAGGELLDSAVSEKDPALAGAKRIARDFHERWVIGYGHSSVAEHAVVHVGIERISRLASAELELASRFNSFTEYSQRYQRPRRGDVYIPPELYGCPEALELYESFQNRAYETYEQLYAGLLDDFLRRVPKGENETDRAYRSRLEKMAFEDARYALTLATLTNLGMTGNGRAIRDALVRLLSSPYAECRELARELEEEVAKSLPTLLRHVEPSPYLLHVASRFSDVLQAKSSMGDSPVHGRRSEGLTRREAPEVRWISIPDYREALVRLVTGLWVSFGAFSFEEARRRAETLTVRELEEHARAAWENLAFYEHPHEAFRSIVYQVSLCVSEANWHQLLRHNRGASFVYGPPAGNSGWVIPPRIERAGLAEVLAAFQEKADEVWERMQELCPEAAPYCVTNAHRREVIMTVDLWELYHLINLRTSSEAQWDIRRVFEYILEELAACHPALVGGARRRP
ncbi:MAG: FAD-dependent thymidylate synthase [Alicyclobacillaceae bacterium]|nr:FAD-dependent thymidylate synthase [Alicyclobacillaceae bacterium]